MLGMSLRDPAIRFPRFLLIDTPETAGIDRENLIQAMKSLEKVLQTDDNEQKMPSHYDHGTRSVSRHPPGQSVWRDYKGEAVARASWRESKRESKRGRRIETGTQLVSGPDDPGGTFATQRVQRTQTLRLLALPVLVVTGSVPGKARLNAPRSFSHLPSLPISPPRQPPATLPMCTQGIG